MRNKKKTTFVTLTCVLEVNIGISRYKTNFHAENINFACRATDFEGAEFDFRSSVSGYKEKQEVTFLQIPLVLQYHSGNYYVAGGVL